MYLNGSLTGDVREPGTLWVCGGKLHGYRSETIVALRDLGFIELTAIDETQTAAKVSRLGMTALHAEFPNHPLLARLEGRPPLPLRAV